jgi:predicted lipoprotein with Yx(FWY)xxD motif
MTWNLHAVSTDISARRKILASAKKPSPRSALSGLVAIAVAGLVAACGTGGATTGYGGSGGATTGYGGTGAGQTAGAGQQPAKSHGPAVVARKLAGLGTVLVDRSGKTIYSPQQEAHGKILCTGSCLGFWFPVTVSPGTSLPALRGVSGVLGTVHRQDDGLTQLTFNGRPLYTFRLDQAPGQVHGNNFSDSFGGTSFIWQVVAASGAASSSTQSTKPGNGYSYPASGAYGN